MTNTIRLFTPTRPCSHYAIRYETGDEAATLDAIVSDAMAGIVTPAEAASLAAEVGRRLAVETKGLVKAKGA